MDLNNNFIKDLITVIVPVYNVEKYLEQCVDSILNQTYKNIEIILVDDGSKDKSGQLCNEFSNKYSQIKTIHKKKIAKEIELREIGNYKVSQLTASEQLNIKNALKFLQKGLNAPITFVSVGADREQYFYVKKGELN